MKKILILTVVLVLSFTGISLAQTYNYSLEGGFVYTTLDPDSLNEIITLVNNFYQNELEYYQSDPNYDIQVNEFDKIEDFDSATGFWIGLQNDLGNYKLGTNYETFSEEVDGNFYVTDLNTGNYLKVNDSLEIEVEGIYIDLEKPINEYFSISAGIGYYKGELSVKERSQNKINGTFYQYKISGKTDLEEDFGFKVGVSTDYPLSDNLSLLGNLNYRKLELDIEDSSESVDFDGVELKAGLTYEF
ncbi:MAG: hypothetical protein ACQERJ_09770 [Bacillota bacterium]